MRLRTPDCDDAQVWLQSSIATTHKLPRGCREDFSFTRDSLQQISNRGGGPATLILESIKCGESGICIGSNRRGSCVMHEGQQLKILMRPGEVLTLRSLDAIEPGGSNADGSPIKIRPGQSLVF